MPASPREPADAFLARHGAWRPGHPLPRIALAVTALAGLGTWGIGIRSMAYDHDEVTKAHSIWMAGRGLMPYVDFLDSHPPYFRLLTPLLGDATIDPVAFLERLRVFSLAGNLLFLCGIASVGLISTRPGREADGNGNGDQGGISRSRGIDRRSWGLLGLLAIVLHPTILTDLVEFRTDGWAYALIAWSLFRFLRRPDCAARYVEFGLVSTAAGLLLCPKLAILPPMVVGRYLVASRGAFRSRLAHAAGYAAGIAAAFGLSAAYLLSQGIPLRRAYDMVFAFNAIHNAHAGYPSRLRNSIFEDTLPFAIFAAGIVAWAWCAAARRGKDGGAAVYPSVLAWLILQAALVAYPFKQYYAPWFLVGSMFAFPLGGVARAIPRRAATPIFLVASAALLFQTIGLARSWTAADEAGAQGRLIRWMGRVSIAGDRVAAAAPLHPIDRPDAFTLWFSTFDPSGFDAEQVLRRIPALRELAEPARYREELERNPPALVVISGDWRVAPRAAGQQAAITDFFRRHPYHAVRVGNARFALRPDRYERARAGGLLSETH
ncbi:hypothetical protein OJF2_13170 [Aquisphaera giovannonii]|uniref:Glycosyltransferase RgtA/B/C/D-like domain-containing protein n=1 Tax=Aquisphaera giovannonii TaxID=406548 RepID=A0A5B9VWX6_9BACT|nr:hypothetical protein [Aquisphaera giovannonii]QEH32833.1 hypothetical protein OJF2_13170 [Aquisphaera giovannonii]